VTEAQGPVHHTPQSEPPQIVAGPQQWRESPQPERSLSPHIMGTQMWSRPRSGRVSSRPDCYVLSHHWIRGGGV